ncbi:hypothetical protein K469DRAFT_732655 [Zopfia rhizophila CBS 207.26]|uniref:Rhodopsin domain-containing protein n=1 Tax=Zopfia rhizophila CBS 207.26 TaxID=1314779 RepID=A0A6A6EM49_9PEZI|nr:hypothetical protein K469DRAFT_732655 [Zopfia rhizophila CBS 207.26]
MAVHGTAAVVVTWALTSLSTIVVALRFYSRYFLVGKISSPDYVMLLALLATWAHAVVTYYQVHFLDYSGAWESKERLASIVRGSLLTFWIYRIIYILDLCLIKISILLFYNYVASAHKSFHWIVFFNGAKGIKNFKCYNPVILWFFSAGFNLVTDLIIWVLPMPFLLNLQSMPIKRRLELVGIFSIGIIAIIASGIRLWIMVLWTSSFIEQGKQTGNFLIWGQVEPHAGIISASIPFLRPLVRKAFGVGQRREQPSPSPAANLLAQNQTPENPLSPRTPIIPSPSPTIASSVATRHVCKSQNMTEHIPT